MITLQQQIAQADEEARNEKAAAEKVAYDTRQAQAAAKIKQVRWDAEKLVQEIEYDAKK